MRVLYVDDDPRLAEMAVDYLERRDDALSAVAETSVRAAMERLERERVDCVVSDHRMPGADGLEFCRRVRRERPDVPFILVTGHASDAAVDEAEAAGVDECLEKGRGMETYDELRDRIRRATRSTGRDPEGK